jgi:RNA polymerase sigma factor (sigma-70 family)
VLRSWHDAEDAFQATFLVLAKKAASVRRPASLASWLYGVAYHLALRARARDARRRARQPRAHDMAPANPLLDLTCRELQAVLHEELHKLPEKYRAPLVLCYLEGRTQEEAARQLRWSKGAVRGRLDRGREQLRKRLARRGLALSACAALLAPRASAAVVPAALAGATVKTASLVIAGRAAGAISSPVADLVDGALKALFPGTGKVVTALALAVGLLAAGLGALAADALPAPPAPEKASPSGAKAAEQAPAAPGKPGRVDRYGDPLPAGALQRLGTGRMRHGYGVHALTFSQDGRRVISAAPAGSSAISVIAWDTATGKGSKLGQFPFTTFHSNPALAFSADRNVLACVGFGPAGRETIFLRDAATGKELRHFASRQDMVMCAAFAPDGKTLVTGSWEGLATWNGGTVRLWEVATGKEARRLPRQQKGIAGVVFSPDGKRLATAGADNTVRLWDPVTGKELGRVTTAQRWAGAVTFSPDGKLLAYAGKDRPALLDVATGKPGRALRRLPESATALTFSADGRLLLGGLADGTLAVWDVGTGKALRRWHGHTHSVSLLRLAPDGKTLASASHFEGALRLWELAGGKEVLPLAGHRGPARPLYFSADGRRLLTTGRDNTLRGWDLATGRQRVLFRRPWRDPFGGPFLSPDRKTFITYDRVDKTIHQWDARTGKEVRVLGTCSFSGRSAVLTHAFSPDGKILAARADRGAIVLWSLRTGKELGRLAGHEDEVLCLQFSPDGKALASGAVPGNALGLRDYAVRLWDVANGKELRHFSAPRGVGSLLFSPDGKLLASGGGMWTRETPDVYVWDVAGGRRLHHLPGATEPLAWSADGRLLAVAYEKDEAKGYDAQVAVCEAATGGEVRRFAGRHTSLLGAAFAPDGRTLATGCWDSSLLIWDLTGRQNQGRLRGGPLTAADREACWAALAGAAADKAYAAIWKLAADPDASVAFLKDHLRPAAEPDRKQISRLAADLGNERFTVRQKASQGLAKLGTAAAPALRRALAAKLPLELRRRLEGVLEKLEGRPLPAEELRQVRAVTVLEQIGTPEAVRLLERLAAGAGAAPLTRAARSSTGRLAKRAAATP